MIAGSRTLLALALVGVTVAVPSAAWFVAGGREAERAAAIAEIGPLTEARRTVRMLANQLGARLDALRGKESARPYYHYQALYHDPGGASEGASVVPSPLAGGSEDPLVLGHFQVDESGRLELPTLEGATTPDSVLAHSRVLAKALEPAAPKLRALLGPRPTTDRQIALLERSAYVQNLNATQLYRDIKRKQAGVPVTGNVPTGFGATGKVEVMTDALSWRTLEIAGTRRLVALRTVSGPSNRWVQGFVIDPAEVDRILQVASLPTTFVVAPPKAVFDVDERQSYASISETGWALLVVTEPVHKASRAQAAAIREKFRRMFTFGTAAAALAGLGVVGLVWQSERLARQRSRFAAAAAHELRTPLAGLRLHGEMLAEGLGDPARSRVYARTIADEAERLGRVVGNVLGFTRLERGTLRVETRAGDLAAAVSEGVARHRPALEAAGASVVLAVEDGLPPARFDADAVHQIVHNLLDNAERHTRTANDRRIEVDLRATADGVALAVRDHGPGMPDGARPRPFRAHGGGASGGLGLGLPLVDALARAQDGTLSIARADGGGASIRVTLPRA